MAASSTLGVVTDYFGLESATHGALVAEWSDDGLARDTTVEHNGNDGDKAGREPPPYDQKRRFRNPSVRYRVVANVNLSVVIGKGFGATSDGVKSGYMIAAVRVETMIGDAPSVTVQGVANEGVNAARTYTFTASLTPRHRPQDALSAINTGGGDLIDISFGFTCDAVVVLGPILPSASDITHGRLEATATIADYSGSAAPTARSPFVMTTSPLEEPGDDYHTYKINAFREVF